MKTSRQVVGATAGFMLALSTVACTDSDPEPDPDVTTTSPSPTPTATADPASAAIPVDGDDDVPIEWSTDGVDVGDPAVVVARRNIVVRLLASDSGSWIDESKLLSALDSVSKGDDVAKRRFQRIAKARPVDRKPLPGPYHVLLMTPTAKGGTVGVDACVVIDDAHPETAGLGADDDPGYELQKLTLQIVDGAWKVTQRAHEFAGSPEADPQLEKRCKAYADSVITG